MQLLRDQLDTKDAMLANKEQELEVLCQTVDGRSTVGYVSDLDEDSEDGSDANGNKVDVPGVEESNALKEQLLAAENEKINVM
eukprot:672228-Ditylum_brightwellii.AAC.1